MTFNNASANREWPFIGLRPFELEDHEFFFGRESEVETLLQQVADRRFIAAVGSSGCGKSSLIRAGLQSKIKRAYPKAPWIDMRPGGAPIRNLALALAQESGAPSNLQSALADRLQQELNKSRFGMSKALELLPNLQEPAGGQSFLLVDQFEELFRFAEVQSEANADEVKNVERRDDDEARAFVRLLLSAVESDLPIHVIITMRSDFIGECARFDRLPEAVSQNQFLVPGMTRVQREAVIRGPIQAAQSHVDWLLVQRALNDTDEDLDQLPILQHAMMRCWENAFKRIKVNSDQRPSITLDDYNKVGGVAAALSLHANEILEELRKSDHPSADLSLVTKRVFQALTETDRKRRSIRRPQRFVNLVRYVEAQETDGRDFSGERRARTVVERFARKDCSFLRAPTDFKDNDMIDIGHEALIRRWDKLEGEGKDNWVREEQDDAEKYQNLLRFAESDAIISADEVEEFKCWWDKRQPTSFWTWRYAKHNVNEDENEQSFNLAHEYLQRRRADTEAVREYESRIVGIFADRIRVARAHNGAADSLAMALNKSPVLPDVAEYVEVLYRALGEVREQRRLRSRDSSESQVFAVTFSADAELLLVAVSGKLLFYKTSDGVLIHEEPVHVGWNLGLRWSPDRKRIFIGTSPVGSILALGAIEKLHEYFKDPEAKKRVDIGNSNNPAGSGVWSRDGKWIVVAGFQNQASIWDTHTGAFQGTIDDELPGTYLPDRLATTLAGSADGSRIAVGASSGKVHILNAFCAQGNRLSFEWQESFDPIVKDYPLQPYPLAFDPRNSDRLLAGYFGNPIMTLWKTGEKHSYVSFGDERSGNVMQFAFDRKGGAVASATNDGIVRLWVLPEGGSRPTELQLRGHLTSVFAVDISAADGNIASGSNDGTIRIWTRHAPLSARLLADTTAMLRESTKFIRRDRRISVMSNKGEISAELPENFGEVAAVAVGAAGAAIAVVPPLGEPWLLANIGNDRLKVAVPLPGADAEWTAITFIDNDTRIAARTKEGKIFAWPFISDVRELEKLAQDHLPWDGSGFEKRISVPPFMVRRQAAPKST